MTIGDLSSMIGRMPSWHKNITVALLPTPIKSRNIPQDKLDEQWQTNREVPKDVLQRVHQPHSSEDDPSAESWYYNVLRADGKIRRCKQVLAAWLADCPQYCDLHHCMRHVCFWCECPHNEHWDYVPPVKQHLRWDHNLYRALSDANANAVNAKPMSRHVHTGFSVV